MSKKQLIRKNILDGLHTQNLRIFQVPMKNLYFSRNSRPWTKKFQIQVIPNFVRTLYSAVLKDLLQALENRN